MASGTARAVRTRFTTPPPFEQLGKMPKGMDSLVKFEYDSLKSHLTGQERKGFADELEKNDQKLINSGRIHRRYATLSDQVQQSFKQHYRQHGQLPAYDQTQYTHFLLNGERASDRKSQLGLIEFNKANLQNYLTQQALEKMDGIHQASLPAQTRQFSVPSGHTPQASSLTAPVTSPTAPPHGGELINFTQGTRSTQYVFPQRNASQGPQLMPPQDFQPQFVRRTGNTHTDIVRPEDTQRSNFQPQRFTPNSSLQQEVQQRQTLEERALLLQQQEMKQSQSPASRLENFHVHSAAGTPDPALMIQTQGRGGAYRAQQANRSFHTAMMNDGSRQGYLSGQAQQMPGGPAINADNGMQARRAPSSFAPPHDMGQQQIIQNQQGMQFAQQAPVSNARPHQFGPPMQHGFNPNLPANLPSYDLNALREERKDLTSREGDLEHQKRQAGGALTPRRHARLERYKNRIDEIDTLEERLRAIAPNS